MCWRTRGSRVPRESGDSLNGITDAIRVRDDFDWIHVRHALAVAR